MADQTPEARIRDLQRRLDLDPGSRLFVSLAEEYRKIGRLKDSLSALQKGLLAHPGYVAAQVALGRVYVEAGQTTDAVATFTKVLVADPGNLVAAKSLADIYMARGDKLEAVKKYKLYRALSGDRKVDPVIAELETQVTPKPIVPARPPAKAPVEPPPPPKFQETDKHRRRAIPKPLPSVADEAPFEVSALQFELGEDSGEDRPKADEPFLVPTRDAMIAAAPFRPAGSAPANVAPPPPILEASPPPPVLDAAPEVDEPPTQTADVLPFPTPMAPPPEEPPAPPVLAEVPALRALVDGDQFGFSVAALGDLDGDGLTDLGVGANYDRGGAVHVLSLNANGTVKSFKQKIGDNLGGGPDLAADDSFGSAVAALGDLDGDGIVDLAVGAERDRLGSGSVHILFLRPTAEPLDGDFNQSGAVDAADLAIWSDHFGATASAGPSEGDADGDLDVDGNDFLTWQRNLGRGVSLVPSAASSVLAPQAVIVPSLSTDDAASTVWIAAFADADRGFEAIDAARVSRGTDAPQLRSEVDREQSLGQSVLEGRRPRRLAGAQADAKESVDALFADDGLVRELLAPAGFRRAQRWRA